MGAFVYLLVALCFPFRIALPAMGAKKTYSWGRGAGWECLPSRGDLSGPARCEWELRLQPLFLFPAVS